MKYFKIVVIFLMLCTVNVFANSKDHGKKNKASIKELKEKLKSLKSGKPTGAYKSSSKINTLPPMSKKEQKAFKKSKIKEIKKAIQKAKSNNNDTGILMVILTVLIPPLAVALVFDIGEEFWISLLLTLLLYLPGLIYSLIKIFA